jgi:hypothetical protein
MITKAFQTDLVRNPPLRYAPFRAPPQVSLTYDRATDRRMDRNTEFLGGFGGGEAVGFSAECGR